ncbi:MAG: AAA family ATPase [Candidatus Moranbacteria bacterium]|nr:AAA family ATPase [Candidatus Moranbacteria bacterium]MDD3965144.1 AAA family ATPase [Candidatus Moranbacteria bacterium]
MHIIGHHKERKRLERLVREDSISQGYLFVGPESVGKSFCALAFASELVSEPDFVPTTDKPYPFDVRVITPQEETKRSVTKQKNIGVDEIREALLFLGQFPIHGKYRVIIIEDAHKLSSSAQNVLLKTLEEPNPSAVIILVTHQIGNIIPTILSRIERVRFSYVSPEDMQSGLASVVERNKETVIAPFFFTLGRPGMILRLLSHPEKFVGEQEKLSRLFRLTSLSLGERLVLAEELAKNVPETIHLLEWWLPGLYRQALKGENIPQTKRFFLLLETVEQALSLLRNTQSNARLLLEKLFLSL